MWGLYRGSMNLQSLDWRKLMHESQVASVFFNVCVFCKFMK